MSCRNVPDVSQNRRSGAVEIWCGKAFETRLGLSHWEPYAVRRGGCLQLYYCNIVEWFWWDSRLIFDDQLVSFSALTLLV